MTSPSAIRERLFRAAALVALAGAVAAPALAQDQAAQEIHDRLIGKQTAPAAATGAAKCDTATEIENDPACAASVSGPGRPWSLTGHAAPARPAQAVAAPAAFVHAHTPPVQAANARRAMPEKGAAAGCDLNQAGDAHSVNLCLTFGLNSATLTPASRTSLDNLAAALSQADLQARKVLIQGYADASGNTHHNLKLSDARAHAAAKYLVAHGVSADRLAAKGFGASHPLPGRDPKDAVNRRVEAVLAD